MLLLQSVPLPGPGSFNSTLHTPGLPSPQVSLSLPAHRSVSHSQPTGQSYTPIPQVSLSLPAHRSVSQTQPTGQSLTRSPQVSLSLPAHRSVLHGPGVMAKSSNVDQNFVTWIRPVMSVHLRSICFAMRFEKKHETRSLSISGRASHTQWSSSW